MTANTSSFSQLFFALGVLALITSLVIAGAWIWDMVAEQKAQKEAKIQELAKAKSLAVAEARAEAK